MTVCHQLTNLLPWWELETSMRVEPQNVQDWKKTCVVVKESCIPLVAANNIGHMGLSKTLARAYSITPALWQSSIYLMT